MKALAIPFLYWVAEVVRQLEPVADIDGQTRANARYCLVQVDIIRRSLGRFLPDAAMDQIVELIECTLLAYNSISHGTENLERRVCLYSLIPTVHTLTHVAYDMSQWVNPQRVHCYD